MQVGVVKWYDSRMGYGFIITESGEDVLAHYSVIEGTGFRRLYDGEKVEYEAARGPKGLNATVVRRLNIDKSKEQGTGGGQPKVDGPQDGHPRKGE